MAAPQSSACPADEGHSCWLDHGDLLVLDGQCQDKFLHRTDPCREQERINVTFRWIKQHVSSCPLFQAGVACCLPTCAQGSSVPVMENAVYDVFFCFLISSWCLVHMESSSFATLPAVYRAWVTLVCLLLDTPFGRNLWGEYLKVHKTAFKYLGIHGHFMICPYMLASTGQPSLHGYDACTVYWTKGALRRNCRQKVW